MFQEGFKTLKLYKLPKNVISITFLLQERMKIHRLLRLAMSNFETSFLRVQKSALSSDIKDLEQSIHHKSHKLEHKIDKLEKVLRHEKPRDDDDFQKINESRINEIMEYYSQYEKELQEGGYKDPQVEETWMDRGRSDAEKYPVSLKRGRHGVFDVEEMVTILNHQKIVDLCCVKLPPELQYAEHMLIGSVYSLRHMRGIVQYILTLYKKKRGPDDPQNLERPSHRIHSSSHKTSDADWMALDAGNLVVHLMMPDARRRYDLEQLWSVGPEFDEKTLEKSKVDEMREEFEDFRKQIEKQRSNEPSN